jgi:putative ABC transport system substrate-binding protein
MRRREFIAGLASAWPLAARAQPADRLPRIGALMAFAADDAIGRSRAAAFAKGLEELGWIDERNLRIDYRWAGSDSVQIRAAAQQLVDTAPRAIVSAGTPATLALKQATASIPVVFIAVNDPISQGIVQSLAHPGGNLTGFALFEASMGGKWLEMLKEMAPAITRVTVIFNPETTPFFKAFIDPIEAAASTFAVEVIAAPVRDDAGIERAIVSAASTPGGGLFLLPDLFTVERRAVIIELAARYRLPAVSYYSKFATEGGLFSYGSHIVDLYRRAASYVDRILKGTDPKDLPVQQPNKFQFLVNLRTAKALGLTVPPTLLAQADEVIE